MLGTLFTNFLSQQEWVKEKEENRCREHELEEQLRAFTVDKDRLATEVEANSKQFQLYKHQVAGVEWRSGCKDTKIHLLKNMLQTQKQKTQLQKDWDVANHQIMEALEKRKDYQFELSQCLAPLAELKDVHAKLSERSKESIVL